MQNKDTSFAGDSILYILKAVIICSLQLCVAKLNTVPSANFYKLFSLSKAQEVDCGRDEGL